MHSRARRAVAALSACIGLLAVGGALGGWPVGAPATAQNSTAQNSTAQNSTAQNSTAQNSTAQNSTAQSRVIDSAPVPLFGPALTLLRSVQLRDLAGVTERSPGPHAGRRDSRVAVLAHSGDGRRVVFDMSAQRVWLVRAKDEVLRSYRVSGSIYDNLRPGAYEVYSRSRSATAFDYSATMQYFVRFTRGYRAAIGFHDIPVDSEGRRVQTLQQLGEPLSSGCIRQRRADAKALWEFAPTGTRVVVIA